MTVPFRDRETLDRLFSEATGARARAYAPYSGYAVGAAILDDTGTVSVGCNVENAAYPVGTCAEAGAIAAMVAGGGRRIAAILVVAGGDVLVAPCGACRQRIREFAVDATPIYMADPTGRFDVVTAGDLLPRAFGPDTLAGAAR